MTSAPAPAAPEPAIEVRGLSKCYHIYEKPRDRLAQALWRGRRTFYREFWALREANLAVAPGDAGGIVGRNGSGKSTMLQLICGTLSPTEGTVGVRGRVAALLELGSGFNPELTGRENVVMNATILGLSPEEIDARFESIVAFSEIGEFLEQPIRTYSSGMIVRLAFAVAVNVDADVVVIDEALAVGDARFQLKCAKAMDRLRDSGKTLLFVSHDGNAIKRLCSKAVLLERGRLLVEGAPNDVLNIYSKLIADERGAEAVAGDIAALVAERSRSPAVPAPRAPEKAAREPEIDRERLLHALDRGAGQVTDEEFSYGGSLGRIESLVVTAAAGEPRTTYTTGEKARVEMLLAAGERDLEDTIFAIVLKDVKGQDVYGTNTYFQDVPTPAIAAGSRLAVRFDLALNLMPGTYFVSLGWTHFEGTELRVIHRRYDVVRLEILGTDRSIGIANCFATIGFESLP